MKISPQEKDAVLRIGEVTEVSGRKVFVSVDKNKNLSDLFFDGDFIRNVSVNSYIEIKKGFLTLIGKVEGEKVEAHSRESNALYSTFDRNKRTLTVALVGFLDKGGKFFGGTRELPLLGNEAFLVTSKRIHQIHRLVSGTGISVSFACTEYEDYRIEFPVDGLFNSHIAIFGNTGSGKSNTLARIFKSFVDTMMERNEEAFTQRCRFLLFDFNGEYARDNCITTQKQVFNLSTRRPNAIRVPISETSILDIEMLSILSDATEKTQKPFLKRAVDYYRHVINPDAEDPTEHFKNILRYYIRQILAMSDKVRVEHLMDYIGEILPDRNEEGERIALAEDLEWHNTLEGYKVRGTRDQFLKQKPDLILETFVYRHVDTFEFNENILSRLISFLYLQLISDLLANRAQNEHIAPAINKLKSKQKDIERVLDTTSDESLWEQSNFVVINLNNVSLEMKKTIPLLISRKAYEEQKARPKNTALSIIIDEAHNILSTASARESESWKDYRLETFEEVIKEGRKFGVFVTIASQRPNDISPTITSQAHNYFIHRLINQKDLATIANAVSYIDQLSEASIPTLPTGTCIFSGTAGQMPLKLIIDKLPNNERPRSGTVEFEKIVPEAL